MQRIANNINMLKSHWLCDICSLLHKNTTNAVILTRYFVTLSCKSHSTHIQKIYIPMAINASKPHISKMFKKHEKLFQNKLEIVCLLLLFLPFYRLCIRILVQAIDTL